MADGTGESAERVRRIFPLSLIKSRSKFGVSAGPRPLRNYQSKSYCLAEC